MKQRLRFEPGVFLRGMAMGAADVVPGVSGGTVAFVSGIYERLLNALSQCNPGVFKVWHRSGLAAAWSAIDGTFLVTLISGMLLSIVALAGVISALLASHPHLVWSFFSGLIAVSGVVLFRQLKQMSALRYLQVVSGLLAAGAVAVVRPDAVTVSELTIFLSGMLASCAMILPGISGSFLLLLINMYEPVIHAVKSADVIFLGLFVAGAVIGLMMFSKVLHWLFNRFHEATLAVLTGFLIGSLSLVWPWQVLPSGALDDVKHQVVAAQRVLPSHYEFASGQAPDVLLCIVLALLGGALVWLIERHWGSSVR